MIFKARKLRLSWQKLIVKFCQSWRYLLFLVLLGLIILILVLGVSFWQRQNIRTTGFALGFGNQTGWVAAIDRQAGSLTMVRLPAKLLVPVVNGQGRYPLSGLESLAEIVGNVRLKADSIGLLFRTSLVSWEKADFEDWNQRAVKKQLAKFSWQCLWEGGSTGLAPADCGRLWLSIKRMSVRKIRLVDLETTGLVNEVAYAQTPVLEVSTAYYDQLPDWWEDSRFKKTDFVYGVANSTQFNGLAGVVTDYLENWGGSVVKVGDWSGPVDNCQIRFKPGKKLKQSYSFKKVLKAFGCEVIEGGLEDYMVDILFVTGNRLGEYAREVVLAAN